MHKIMIKEHKRSYSARLMTELGKNCQLLHIFVKNWQEFPVIYKLGFSS